MQRIQRCCYDRAAQTIVAPTFVCAGIIRDDRDDGQFLNLNLMK